MEHALRPSNHPTEQQPHEKVINVGKRLKPVHLVTPVLYPCAHARKQHRINRNTGVSAEVGRTFGAANTGDT